MESADAVFLYSITVHAFVQPCTLGRGVILGKDCGEVMTDSLFLALGLTHTHTHAHKQQRTYTF